LSCYELGGTREQRILFSFVLRGHHGCTNMFVLLVRE
jgi:hypothetical protein